MKNRLGSSGWIQGDPHDRKRRSFELDAWMVADIVVDSGEIGASSRQIGTSLAVVVHIRHVM